MALAICEGCTTAYAPDLPACPHCWSTDRHEQGEKGNGMPKISEHGGPTYGPESARGALPSELVYDVDDDGTMIRRDGLSRAERREAIRNGDVDPVVEARRDLEREERGDERDGEQTRTVGSSIGAVGDGTTFMQRREAGIAAMGDRGNEQRDFGEQGHTAELRTAARRDSGEGEPSSRGKNSGRSGQSSSSKQAKNSDDAADRSTVRDAADGSKMDRADDDIASSATGRTTGKGARQG
jgi:hypothetical protein